MLTRRHHRGLSPEHRAKLAAKATAMHAKRRGWAIRPDLMPQYALAYGRLSYQGISRDEICRQLRPLYAVEGWGGLT